MYVIGRDIQEQELALGWSRKIGSWNVLGDAAQYRLTRVMGNDRVQKA